MSWARRVQVALGMGAAAGVLVVGVVAHAAPLGVDLPLADPVAGLTAAQREAARSLGTARRLAEEGRTGEARVALARVEGVPSLAGYADLVRVHLLLKPWVKGYQLSTMKGQFWKDVIIEPH